MSWCDYIGASDDGDLSDNQEEGDDDDVGANDNDDEH